ncbi:glycosyltransferase [Pantanalinema sp. GBBB05]|uniref:glycosyltransferase n=1 Tax=Pantanalinema sp. GBBB05 TaxID=2604139 RepID=UPI001DED8457|nr:glycosyltransferase [Pantanalinema sp. GBBB05]
MIYLITVNYCSTDLIDQLLASIKSTGASNFKLVIVNNSPDDRRIQTLAGASVFVLEAQKNLGFGSGCNLGLQWVYHQDPQAIVWLINPDTTLPEAAVTQANQFFQTHPDLAIVGTVVEQPNGQPWFTGGQFIANTGAIQTIDLFSKSSEADYVACDWVTGCSMLLNFRQFSHCPQFDPAYFLYYEDFDFCQRYQQAGYSVGITNSIRVIHQPSSISDRNLQTKFRYSTFSYLLTLERYAGRLTLGLRLLRLALHALVLLPVKPPIAIGKLQGIVTYFTRNRDFE